MATLEFLELARTRLAQDGVIVTNVIGGDRRRRARSCSGRSIRTYRAAFPSVVVHPVLREDGDDRYRLPQSDHRRGATEAPSKGAPPALAAARSRFRRAPDLPRRSAAAGTEPISAAGVPILTDDYAPTDSLLVKF